MGRGGQVEYAAGFGFADIERQLPFTPDTPTDGASMGPQGIVPPRGPARLEDGRSTGITLGSWHGSADGRRQTANVKRQTANGKRQTANGKRRYYTGSHNGFFCFDCVDEARNIAIAWVANDGPPSWLQPALSRALMAIAEGRVPEPLVAPQAADPTVDPSVVPTVVPTVDPSGRYRVNAVGEVSVQRDGQQLHVRHRGVQYQGFPVARGVHDVPGLDACLRFSSTAQAPAALSWDSVFVAVPSVARDGPDADR